LATDEEFVEISFKAAIAMCFGSFLLVPLCLRIVIPWELVKHNLVFIFCSLATVMGPVTGISLVSFEFPALIGGMIGCAGTAVLIRFKVGLSEAHSDDVDGREVLDIGTVSENSIVRKHFNSLSSRSEIAASQPPQHSGEDHPSLGITPEEVVADNTAEDEKKEVDPEPFHEQPQTMTKSIPCYHGTLPRKLLRFTKIRGRLSAYKTPSINIWDHERKLEKAMSKS
jgi:hypothetical protein